MSATLTKALLRAICRARGDDAGQSLVILAIAMVVVMGMSALAIDVGSWQAQRHHDQVVADASALAAAGCLGNPGAHSGLGPSCTSGTDVTDAIKVAVDYAAANGVTILASNVTVDPVAGTVNVTASSVSPSYFANLFGIHSNTESAVSQAKWTAGSSTTPCTAVDQILGQCEAIYATDTSCPAAGSLTQGAVVVGGSNLITGSVHSNGNLFINQGTYSGALSYGTGSGCGAYNYSGLSGGYNGWLFSGSLFLGGYPTSQSESATVPVPYGTSADPFPTCTNSTTVTSSNPNLSLIGAAPINSVYCFNNTSTSTATITIGLYGTALNDTLICTSSAGAGPCNITLSGGGVVYTAYNYNLLNLIGDNRLLMYASGNINMGGGAASFTGDIDAPNGTITANSGSNLSTGLLEGNDVIYGGGSAALDGDGPATATSATTTDYLSQ